MFDFFRDIALEAIGKDSTEEERKRKEKREQERKKYFIFSRSTKTVVFVFGALYLFMGGISLFANAQITKSIVGISANASAFAYLKYAILSAVDIAAIICLLTKKKKAEIVALVLVIIFMIIMYVSSTAILFF